MKAAILITARLKSTRLPMKVLKPIPPVDEVAFSSELKALIKEREVKL